MRVTGAELDDNQTAEQIRNEVRDILIEALTWTKIAEIAEQDMDHMERSVQSLLRLVGGRLMELLVDLGVARHAGPAPLCPHCQRPMRRVGQRSRQMHGLVGDFIYARPYYQCRACGGGLGADDDRLGVGAQSYTPALSRVAALAATDVPFEQAVRNLSETLGATFGEADIYRVVEGLGAVAESEIQAEIEAPDPEPVAPDGDTLCIGMDGTTSFIEGAWREVKVGVVGTLGPEARRDPITGRELLVVKHARYCAAANTEADAFLPRVRLIGRQAGLGHPDLRRVVFINDGAPWIWARVPSLAPAGVERIEILDYYHVTEHVSRVAEAFWLDKEVWVRPVLENLLDHGPATLLAALGELRPRTKAQRTELRRAKAYFGEHQERMRYPDFIAQQLPIASGIVEATCRSVVCQRTKSAGMRWTRLGAQAVLNLRCLKLSSHDAWRTFFDGHPLRRAPRVACVRRPPQEAA